MLVQSDARAQHLLHTLLRAHDPDASPSFHTDQSAIRPLRKSDFADGRFTPACVGHDNEAVGAAIEQTQNRARDDSCDPGGVYRQLVLAIDDAAALTGQLRTGGAILTPEAGPMKDGRRVIAFLKGPDGDTGGQEECN